MGYNTFNYSAIEAVSIPAACATNQRCGSYLDCKSLKRVMIAAGKIDELDGVFDGCDGLALIQLHEPEPGLLFTDWAVKCAEGCVLEVPSESVEAYKTAPQWRNFSVIRALDPAGVGSITGDEFKAIGLKGMLEVTGCEAVCIMALTGKIVYCGEPGTVQLPVGLYFVTAGGASQKVLVK